VFQDKEFIWTPTFEQSGGYTVSFDLSDGQLNDSKSTQITVNHVNRPPTLALISPQTIDENVLLQFTITGNDSDKEDAGQWILSASNLPQGASFVPATAAFTWTPTYEQSGIFTLTFTNTDPAGLNIAQQAEITVNHVNRPPAFNPIIGQVVDENTLLTFIIPPGEDPDKEDVDKIKYAALSLPEGAAFDPAARILTWTPTYEQ